MFHQKSVRVPTLYCSKIVTQLLIYVPTFMIYLIFFMIGTIDCVLKIFHYIFSQFPLQPLPLHTC